MLKKLVTLFTLMIVLGMGISVVASDAVEADLGSVITLESLGIELNMGTEMDARSNIDAHQDSVMPQLRRVDQSVPIAISSESDVRVLLDALAMIFELTDSCVYVNGDIIAALNEAGLREYWSQGIRELLFEGNEQIMEESGMISDEQFSVRGRLDIPVNTTLRSGQTWAPGSFIFRFGSELEFFIHSTLDQGVQGVLEAGSLDVPNAQTFNIFRILQPRLGQWREDHFVVIVRTQGDQFIAFRNRASGSSSLRFHGTVLLH